MFSNKTYYNSTYFVGPPEALRTELQALERLPITITAIFHTKNCQTKNLRVKIPKSLR